MANPETAYRIRLWAAKTSYSEILKLPYPEFTSMRIALFESGSMLNDVLTLNQVLLQANAAMGNSDGVKKLVSAYKSMLLPKTYFKDSETDKIPTLMKELENTIVEIDKDSLMAAAAIS